MSISFLVGANHIGILSYARTQEKKGNVRSEKNERIQLKIISQIIFFSSDRISAFTHTDEIERKGIYAERLSER